MRLRLRCRCAVMKEGLYDIVYRTGKIGAIGFVSDTLFACMRVTRRMVGMGMIEL
jgi:hypothetical protein